MSELLKKVEKQSMTDRVDEFSPGDTVLVSMKIIEGDKERIQPFQGVVIQKRGAGIGKSLTVRKASGNVYVERIFPLHSPLISEIKVIRRGHVRRAKLYYLRDRTGKSTRIREEK
jgi:large subunit ribosomal protein L19